VALAPVANADVPIKGDEEDSHSHHNPLREFVEWTTTAGVGRIEPAALDIGHSCLL
jgi:hypothetical protein